MWGSSDVGSVSWELRGYGSSLPTITGSYCLANIRGTMTYANGVFSSTVFGNDLITPAKTFYVVQIHSSAGSLIAEVPYYFFGSGNYDLSTYNSGVFE